MATVASHVISQQALSTPSLFSLYSILRLRFRMHWLSPDRLASEVLQEETTVKEAYDRELLKGRAHMRVLPWNVQQLSCPNIGYADQEHRAGTRSVGRWFWLAGRLRNPCQGWLHRHHRARARNVL